MVTEHRCSHLLHHEEAINSSSEVNSRPKQSEISTASSDHVQTRHPPPKTRSITKLHPVLERRMDQAREANIASKIISHSQQRQKAPQDQETNLLLIIHGSQPDLTPYTTTLFNG